MEDIRKIVPPIFSTPQIEEAIRRTSEENNVSFAFALQFIKKFSFELDTFRYRVLDARQIHSIIQQFAERHNLALDPAEFNSSFDNEEEVDS